MKSKEGKLLLRAKRIAPFWPVAVILPVSLIAFFQSDSFWPWLGVVLATALFLQLFYTQRNHTKLRTRNAALSASYRALRRDLSKQTHLLKNQQFISDIQTPVLHGDLEDFLHSILPDICEHLEAYQLTLFLSDTEGSLYPKALYKTSDESQTHIFFLDSVEVDLQEGAAQVFTFGEDGLVPATETTTTAQRVLMPMDLDDDSIKVESERPLYMRGKMVLRHNARFAARAAITIHVTMSDTQGMDLFHRETEVLNLDFSHVDEVVASNKHAYEGFIDDEGNHDLIFTYPLKVESQRRNDEEENIIGALKIWKRVDVSGSENDDAGARAALEKAMEAAKGSIAQAIRKEQVYRKSITDPLTQLYTKRHFTTVLSEALNNFRRYKQQGTLVLVDIDFFKKFNDTYGHLTGDLVLREVAGIMADGCRDTDVPFRYGGEEMAFYLPHTSTKEGHILAERVRQMIEAAEFIAVDETRSTVKVTVSMGIAHFTSDMEKIDDIIAVADEALYASKEAGRNQVTVADQKEEETIEEPSEPLQAS